jgi:hypothetical protein
MNEWMDEWMDGWMDEWMDEWMDGSLDDWMDGSLTSSMPRTAIPQNDFQKVGSNADPNSSGWILGRSFTSLASTSVKKLFSPSHHRCCGDCIPVFDCHSYKIYSHQSYTGLPSHLNHLTRLCTNLVQTDVC